MAHPTQQPRLAHLAHLPVDDIIESITQGIGSAGNLVLRAPTGAGKTTRVAPALLDALVSSGNVVLLQPRRMAARAVAARIAKERNVRLGDEVGYSVRFDSRTSAKTRLTVMTEGVFLRLLQDNPFLDGIATVVFDEFHERSLDADLALALTRSVQLQARTDLQICVMSATLDPAPIAAYLGDCPSIESQGRMFPVEVSYHGPKPGESYESVLSATVKKALIDDDGDVLVFLPGVREIRRAAGSLARVSAEHGIEIAELYGDLSPQRQDAVLASTGRSRRRVILSTNVAETSLTIEGITAVVDSGMAKVLRFDPAVGLDRLELKRISRNSAEQRTGRAGRTRPGRCYRLWSLHDDRSLREQDEAEIRRVDLARAVLQLRAWGEPSARDFGWFEKPEDPAIEAAEILLQQLGAIDARGVTATGRAMLGLPLAPRVACLALTGAALGRPREIAQAAAVLSEKIPHFVDRGHGRSRSEYHLESDVAQRIERAFQGQGSSHGSGNLQRVAERLEQALRGHTKSAKNSPAFDEVLARSLLAAWPDRVARRRSEGSPRALMTGGKGLVLSDTSEVKTSQFFIALELDAGRRGAQPRSGPARNSAEALVYAASAVDPEWFCTDNLHTRVDHEFDDAKQVVTAVKRRLYLDLALSEKNAPIDPDQAGAVLAQHAALNLSVALDLEAEEFTTLRRRLTFARAHGDDDLRQRLPLVDDSFLRDHLEQFCFGKRSFLELRKIALADFILASLDQRVRADLKRLAPRTVSLPTGREASLEYRDEGPPILAARIQELFGMTTAPRVAAGRVAVLVHLLAPNGRPAQMTDDLPSFWSNGYNQVRKELRRRYPKHDWPEDPTTAVASSRPRRKRPAGA